MCGCDRRRAFLNSLMPGLGDFVAMLAEPIQRAYYWMMEKLYLLQGEAL